MVIWTGFDPDAKNYDPYADDVKAYDQYHMFHCEKKSFERYMIKQFECVEYFRSGSNTHFYAYEVKK